MSCFCLCNLIDFSYKKCQKITKKNRRCKNNYKYLSLDGNYKLCAYHTRKYKIDYYSAIYKKAYELPINKDLKQYIHEIILEQTKKDQIIANQLNRRFIIIPKIAQLLKNKMDYEDKESDFECKLNIQCNLIANQLSYLNMITNINDTFEKMFHNKQMNRFCSG
jgi:hypothetical protein